MIYYLYHWYKGDGKHHPDAFEYPFYVRGEQTTGAYALEIEDIHEFVKSYGSAIMLLPPNDDFQYWSIYISGGNRFGQR